MIRSLHDLPIDSEYVPGALNAVKNCLRVQPHERVTLITDEVTAAIGASLLSQIQRIGAPCKTFMLEEISRRPLRTAPPLVLGALAESDVALLCVKSQPGEIASRMQIINTVEQHGVRYAHMVGIDREIMLQSMRADFEAVNALGERLEQMTKTARMIRVQTELGTDLRVKLHPAWRWRNTSGRITPQMWSNLPAGEIFTCPQSVEGVFVVDGSIGDFLCWKYGCVADTPLRLEIAGGRLKHAESENRELVKDFWEYCRTAENGDRVGEFAIGTNTSVERCIGNLLQDEKMPGAHIAFGNPARGQTGADWDCSTHIDVIATGCDIWIDDQQVMERGKFLI